MKKLLLTIGLIFLMPLAAMADIPLKINFQGRFTSTTSVSVDFHITASSPSTTYLWSETGVTVQTPNGVGNYVLGSATTISTSVFVGGSTRYLKVTPSGGSDQYIPLVAAPYTYVASYANELAGGTTVQGTINISSSLTAGTLNGSILSVSSTSSLGDVVPNSDSVKVLGAAGKEWAKLFVDSVTVTNLASLFGYKVSTFTLANAGSQSITGVGFRPRMVIFLGPGTANPSLQQAYSIGAYDGTNSFAFGGITSDSASGSGGYTITAGKVIYTPAEDGTANVEARPTSLDSDGFTINVIGTNNGVVGYIAFQ